MLVTCSSCFREGLNLFERNTFWSYGVVNYTTEMSCKDNFCKKLKILKSVNELECKEEHLRISPRQFIARRKYLMEKIQLVIIDVIKSISNEEPPSIVIKNSRLWKNCEFNEFLTLRSDGEASQQMTSFSALNSKDKLSKIIFLLAKVYRLLLSGSSCTIRELYYQNVNIFSSQSNLKSVLSTVCGVLDAIPWEISLQTTSKGLIAGSLTATGPSGELIDFNKSGGVLIPQDVIKLTSFKSNAKFVLLIEKDAVFQKLMDEKALERLGPCIIMTGKGFPDINTRLMLRRIWEEIKLPIFILVDCDPYGIDIMCVYRFGALAMSQQNKMMAVPAIKWLGVHPQDIKELNIKGVQLTNDDMQKAISLRNRPYIASNINLLNQINMMIESNIKCEIEAFSHISSNYLTDVYIRHKICCMELI